MVADEVVDLLEVGAEDALVGVAGPLRHPGELARAEGRHLAVDVEPGAVGCGIWPGRTGRGGSCVHEPAVLADSYTEAHRLRQLAGADLGGHPAIHNAGMQRSSSVELGPTTADQHCSM